MSRPGKSTLTDYWPNTFINMYSWTKNFTKFIFPWVAFSRADCLWRYFPCLVTTVYDGEPGEPDVPASGRGPQETAQNPGSNQKILQNVWTNTICPHTEITLHFFRSFTICKLNCTFGQIVAPSDSLGRSSWLHLSQIVSLVEILQGGLQNVL